MPLPLSGLGHATTERAAELFTNPTQILAAAIIARAVADALGGDPFAVAWLERHPWAEVLMDSVGLERAMVLERLRTAA